MLTQTIDSPGVHPDRRLKLGTLIRLRWMAMAGQGAAIFVVYGVLNFKLPLAGCLALIAASGLLNIVLLMAYGPNLRLAPDKAALLLAFDLVQLAGLVYLTGGLQNPFSLFILAPVVTSATTQPVKWPLMLGATAVVLTTLLAYYHWPLPWSPQGGFMVPRLYRFGIWTALVFSLFFIGLYTWRVADEARKLADALAATELVLAREHHLSALDGLAAAAAHELGTPLATIAVIARELECSLGLQGEYGEDIALLRSQSERCRGILRRLNTLDRQQDGFFEQISFTEMLEEAALPYRAGKVRITIACDHARGDTLLVQRNPGLIHGIGNLVENASDFARSQVHISATWDDQKVEMLVRDDGRGFAPEVLRHIGEPYFSMRSPSGSTAGGLGLGLFIAKALIARTGGRLTYANNVAEKKRRKAVNEGEDIAEDGGALTGACVRIIWPRDHLDIGRTKPGSSDRPNKPKRPEPDAI